jgi:lysozyme
MAGLVCTLDQAEIWFLGDMAMAVAGVNSTLTRQVTQNQFDALASFTFNVGIGNEAHSTLIRLVNAGQDAWAADEFPKWDHVGKKVSAGLDVRRHAERALYLSMAA